MPAVSAKSSNRVVGEPAFDRSVDRYAIVVVERARVANVVEHVARIDHRLRPDHRREKRADQTTNTVDAAQIM